MLPQNSDDDPNRRERLTTTIGQREGISILDAAVVNHVYCSGEMYEIQHFIGAKFIVKLYIYNIHLVLLLRETSVEQYYTGTIPVQVNSPTWYHIITSEKEEFNTVYFITTVIMC